jgi:uncharacterized protein YggT (Ycf19 family)
VILSWIRVSPNNPVNRFVNLIITPITRPISRRVPPIGFLDISWLIASWAIIFVMNLILFALPPHW